MSEGVEIGDRVAAKDREILDWIESDVIAMSSHPKGWEFLIAGADDEPMMEDAKLFESPLGCIREAAARAKAWQEEQLGPAEPAVRVDDAGCD